MVMGGSSRATANCHTNVLGRVCIKFFLATGRAEIVGGTGGHTSAGRLLLVYLHATYRINCHGFLVVLFGELNLTALIQQRDRTN